MRIWMQWHNDRVRNETMAKNVARLGVFVALAMVFSYIEVLIPFSFGIPGVKLGIANIVVVTGLYLFSAPEVLMISVVRIVLSGVLFGNGVSIVYSLAGGLLSFCVMWLVKKAKGFSLIGVSIAGGVAHNIGQLMAAAAILGNIRIAVYFPVLLVAGMLTGMLIGVLAQAIVRAMQHMEH